MTDTTEALRAQFELYVNPEGDIKLHRLVDGSYAGHGLNQSWMDFQAGHAAGVAAELERCANLTDVQINKYLPLGVAGYSALIGDDEIRAFARAVEATHGIKPAKEDKP